MQGHTRDTVCDSVSSLSRHQLDFLLFFYFKMKACHSKARQYGCTVALDWQLGPRPVCPFSMQPRDDAVGCSVRLQRDWWTSCFATCVHVRRPILPTNLIDVPNHRSLQRHRPCKVRSTALAEHRMIRRVCSSKQKQGGKDSDPWEDRLPSNTVIFVRQHIPCVAACEECHNTEQAQLRDLSLDSTREERCPYFPSPGFLFQ